MRPGQVVNLPQDLPRRQRREEGRAPLHARTNTRNRGACNLGRSYLSWRRTSHAQAAHAQLRAAMWEFSPAKRQAHNTCSAARRSLRTSRPHMADVPRRHARAQRGKGTQCGDTHSAMRCSVGKPQQGHAKVLPRLAAKRREAPLHTRTMHAIPHHCSPGRSRSSRNL
jgi:hypothetical protein